MDIMKVALLIALICSQVLVYRLAKEVGRFTGKEEVYDTFREAVSDDNCYAKGGCK